MNSVHISLAKKHDMMLLGPLKNIQPVMRAWVVWVNCENMWKPSAASSPAPHREVFFPKLLVVDKIQPKRDDSNSQNSGFTYYIYIHGPSFRSAKCQMDAIKQSPSGSNTTSWKANLTAELLKELPSGELSLGLLALWWMKQMSYKCWPLKICSPKAKAWIDLWFRFLTKIKLKRNFDGISNLETFTDFVDLGFIVQDISNTPGSQRG